MMLPVTSLLPLVTRSNANPPRDTVTCYLPPLGGSNGVTVTGMGGIAPMLPVVSIQPRDSRASFRAGDWPAKPWRA